MTNGPPFQSGSSKREVDRLRAELRALEHRIQMDRLLTRQARAIVFLLACAFAINVWLVLRLTG